MRDTFLLVGLAVVVLIAQAFERLLFRRGRPRPDAALADGLTQAMRHGLLDTMLAQPAWLDTTDPSALAGHWGRPAGEPAGVRRSNVARLVASNVDESVVHRKAVGVSVRGRIAARQLITLQCMQCGRDLLPCLEHALLSGCPCGGRPPRLQPQVLA